MFLLDDGGLVLSPSDLANAAVCELAVLRNLDGRLGRSAPVPLAADGMLARVSALGAAHERRVLQEYRMEHEVVTIARPGYDEAGERAALERVQAATLEALRSPAEVVYQAGFFDGRFTGWADFLVREAD